MENNACMDGHPWHLKCPGHGPFRLEPFMHASHACRTAMGGVLKSIASLGVQQGKHKAEEG
jgi:hypothetical protein